MRTENVAAPQPSTHIQKTNKRESILERSSNFRSNAGYGDGSTPWNNEVHHTLVCCLFKYARIEEALNKDTAKTTYCYDCLWITKWDINQSTNLIQLPLWGAYVKAYAALPTVPKGAPPPPVPPPPPPGAPVNLPCHNRDHNNKTGYNRDVKEWLRDNIWNSLNVAQQNHKVDAQIILTHLTNGENKWKAELIRRGSARQGGTVAAWINRRNNWLWYEPFSMAETATPRTVP